MTNPTIGNRAKRGVIRGAWAAACCAALAAPKAVMSADGSPSAAGKSPSLVYVMTDPQSDHATALQACDQLTVAEYRKRGVTVTTLASSELEAWLAEGGKAAAKAHPNFRYLAFAKSAGADAIGGLSFWELSEDQVAGSPLQAGVLINGWGMSLTGCGHGSGMSMQTGLEPRAIPLNLADGEDPWAVPLKVEPGVCSASSGDMMPIGPPGPFMGVQLNNVEITQVLPGAAADKAGLQAGDVLVSIGGNKVTTMADVTAATGRHKAGDTLALQYQRAGKQHDTQLTLIDRHSYYAELSPVGKPIPDLVGKDINGKEVRLSALKGKVILLDFWATWCGPCMDELPLQQLLWERMKGQDYVWIGVSADDDAKAWKSFVEDNHLGGTQMLSHEWTAALGVQAFPTTYVINRDGVLQCAVRGTSMAQAVAGLLAK